MSGTIRKLLGAAALLALSAAGSWYQGSRLSALSKPAQTGALSEHFSTSPGDGWMLFAGLLLLLALALASAAAMLWTQERKTQSG